MSCCMLLRIAWRRCPLARSVIVVQSTCHTVQYLMFSRYWLWQGLWVWLSFSLSLLLNALGVIEFELNNDCVLLFVYARSLVMLIFMSYKLTLTNTRILLRFLKQSLTLQITLWLCMLNMIIYVYNPTTFEWWLLYFS